MDSYNGFSGNQRAANGAALRKALIAGTVMAPVGPCSICSDPDAKLEYHSEDYSKPYNWAPPAAYSVCVSCHRNKLHKRFSNPEMWEAFKAHVRRGGYASDLKKPEVASELVQYVSAIRSGLVQKLNALRPYPHVAGTEWWANLTTKASA
jgi:hypothetical protein